MLLFLRVGGLVKIVNICECYRYLLCCHYLFAVATAKHQIAIIFFIVLVASFPTYPGDILCHVYKRDPVARQATPVFRR